MAGLNKVTLIGNVGRDPEIRQMNNNSRVCNFTIATSETWRDRNSGERRERVEWHRIVVFNEPIIKVCENYVRKGKQLYIEGQIETRKFQGQDGQERSVTEIVLRPYKGELQLLGGGQGGGQGNNQGAGGYQGGQQGGGQQGGGQQGGDTGTAGFPDDEFPPDSFFNDSEETPF